MHNISYIAAYDPVKLQTIYSELIHERMELDKKFSTFLRKNEWKMGEEVDTPIWRKYKKDLKRYSQIVKDITLTEFYMKRT